MTAGLALRATGATEIEQLLGRLLGRFGDLTPLMDRLGLAMETQTDERFDQERAPDGARWMPSLRAKVQGGKTLTDSARLRQSITHRASRDRVEVGTNVKYAGVHQGGATIVPKGDGKLKFRLPGGLGFRTASKVVIPARPFLGVSTENEIELVEIAEDWVAEVAPEIER